MGRRAVSDWRNFGPVDGIFWIRGLGVALRFTPRLDSAPGMYRFYPFVFLWVPKAER